MNYFTLVELYMGHWEIVFGDFSRDVVKDELDITLQYDERPRSSFKILRTNEDQASIDEAVNKLNRSA